MAPRLIDVPDLVGGAAALVFDKDGTLLDLDSRWVAFFTALTDTAGANTVKGPSLFRASTKSAAPRAAANVLKDPALTAVSTMSFFSPAMLTLAVRPINAKTIAAR